MKERCKDCELWGRRFAAVDGHYPCQATEGHGPDSMFVSGGDETDFLYTGPEFGCTLFSPKDPT